MFLQFAEEFLSMAARLRTSPSFDKPLDLVPVFAKFDQTLKELSVLLIGPLALIEI